MAAYFSISQAKDYICVSYLDDVASNEMLAEVVFLIVRLISPSV